MRLFIVLTPFFMFTSLSAYSKVTVPNLNSQYQTIDMSKNNKNPEKNNLENEKTILEKKNLHYSFSLGFGYDSFIYYDNNNNASESFLHFVLNSTYYPFSFVAFTWNIGFSVLPSYNNDNLDTQKSSYFPTEVSRGIFFTNLQLETYIQSFSDNLIYFLIGESYYYFPVLNSTNSKNKISYPLSKKSIFYLKVGLGDRFNLFENTVMDINFAVLIPHKKILSTSGDPQGGFFKNIGLLFNVSFGYIY